ncbi:MAG: hypothetical protein U7123_23755 [Potamolinea sp.]
MFAIDDRTRAIAQVRAALKYSPSYKVIRSAGRLVLLDGTISMLRTILGGQRHKSKENTAAVLTPDSQN